MFTGSDQISKDQSIKIVSILCHLHMYHCSGLTQYHGINQLHLHIYDQEAVIYEAVMLSEDIKFMIHVQPAYG